MSATVYDSPALPVWLVSYHAPLWTRSAVLSLQSSLGVHLSIGVIDNSETEEAQAATQRALEDLDVNYLATGSNLGYAGAANVALENGRQRTRAEWFLIGSHDLHVAPDTVRRLLRAAEGHPHHGALAPRFTCGGTAGPALQQADVFCRPDRGSGEEVVPHKWVSGGCMLLRRAALDAVGLFDESFGSYVEDVDLCLRLRDAGWRVGVVTDARASGLGRSNAAASRLIYANGILLRRKREGRVDAAKGLAGLVVHGLRGRLSAALPLLGGSSNPPDAAARATARLQAVPLAVAALRGFGRGAGPASAHLHAARRGIRQDTAAGVAVVDWREPA
jgi:hypothetical protein